MNMTIKEKLQENLSSYLGLSSIAIEKLFNTELPEIGNKKISDLLNEGKNREAEIIVEKIILGMSGL